MQLPTPDPTWIFSRSLKLNVSETKCPTLPQTSPPTVFPRSLKGSSISTVAQDTTHISFISRSSRIHPESDLILPPSPIRVIIISHLHYCSNLLAALPISVLVSHKIPLKQKSIRFSSVPWLPISLTVSPSSPL